MYRTTGMVTRGKYQDLERKKDVLFKQAESSHDKLKKMGKEISKLEGKHHELIYHIDSLKHQGKSKAITDYIKILEKELYENDVAHDKLYAKYLIQKEKHEKIFDKLNKSIVKRIHVSHGYGVRNGGYFTNWKDIDYLKKYGDEKW